MAERAKGPATSAILGADPGWQAWIAHNLERGCNPNEMRASMVAAGWDSSAATAALDRGMSIVPLGDVARDHALPVLPAAGGHEVDGRTVHVQLSLASPAVAVCEDVLSATECADLIAFARDRGLKRSTVVDETTGTEVPHPERRSSGLMLRRGETSLIDRIERRLAALTQWPHANGEGLQILRYGPSDEYRPHFDSFSDGPGSARHMASGGQRVGTVIVYLQRPDAGGGTLFPKAGLTICPPVGSAIAFRNVDKAGRRDPASLHAGQPVERGEKIILTYWQREGGWM